MLEEAGEGEGRGHCCVACCSSPPPSPTLSLSILLAESLVHRLMAKPPPARQHHMKLRHQLQRTHALPPLLSRRRFLSQVMPIFFAGALQISSGPASLCVWRSSCSVPPSGQTLLCSCRYGRSSRCSHSVSSEFLLPFFLLVSLASPSRTQRSNQVLSTSRWSCSPSPASRFLGWCLPLII